MRNSPAHYPSLVAIGEALPYARPRPQTPLYAQMSDVLQRNLSTLTGVTPPPAAMEQAQTPQSKCSSLREPRPDDHASAAAFAVDCSSWQVSSHFLWFDTCG